MAMPMWNTLTERNLDDLTIQIHALRQQITHLRMLAAQTTGEMRTHYKFVITDHVWRLTQLIGAFWRDASTEASTFELQDEGN